MSLFDRFKKKAAIKKAEVKKTVKKPAAVEIEKKEVEKPVEVKKAPVKKVIKTTDAWKALVAPHVTEKATELTASNKYVFKVFKRTNKVEIKRAIEGLYGVDVKDVHIINVKKKARRVGRTQGFRKGYKKAIITVKKGQEIEVLPR